MLFRDLATEVECSKAPIHTESLVVLGLPEKHNEDREAMPVEKEMSQNAPSTKPTEEPVGVVEQRVSNLFQGSLCLVLMSGPFLHVLNLIPRGTNILYIRVLPLLTVFLFFFRPQ